MLMMKRAMKGLDQAEEKTDASDFTTTWNEIRDQIVSQKIRSDKSEMWVNLIKNFPSSSSLNKQKNDLLKPGRSLGYNFLAKKHESFRLRLTKVYLRLVFVTSMSLRYLSHRLWSLIVNQTRFDNLSTYPMFHIALRETGFSKPYQRFCQELGISPDSWSTIKPFYVSSLLLQGLSEPQKKSILEIGGGTGNLATVLNKRLPVSRYVIVDLPEMILYSSLTVRHFFPEKPIYFSHSFSGPKILLPEEGFLFVFPDDIDRLPENSFDFSLNIDSFQEMTERQVRGYIALIQRTTRDGGFFLNINRRKTVGSYDNNPLTYPYDHHNEVIRWEADPFMSRTFLQQRRDPHILRQERVKKM